jgi:hypothetical protein
VNYLEIRAVVAGMRTSFDGHGPGDRGRGAHHCLQWIRGAGPQPGLRGAVRGGESQPISFYLPDGGLAQAPVAMAVELNVRRFTSVGSVGRLDLGASDEQVSVAPDPRGGGQWLFVELPHPDPVPRTAGAQLPVTTQVPTG